MNNFQPKFLLIVCALILSLNVFTAIKNKQYLQEIETAFHAHQQNIEAYAQLYKISHLTYESNKPMENPVMNQKTRFCALAHEGVAIEFDPKTQVALYWNDYSSDSDEASAQKYFYEITRPYVSLKAENLQPPHRLFQIIEVSLEDQVITGLAGGVDLYPEWCDSINSKN